MKVVSRPDNICDKIRAEIREMKANGIKISHISLSELEWAEVCRLMAWDVGTALLRFDFYPVKLEGVSDE